MVPVRQRAGVAVCAEVGAQPLFLGRASAAAAHLTAVGVEGDQVPGADVERVVALPPRSGRARGAPDAVEVVEVAGCAGGLVLVVAGGRVSDALQAAPAEVVCERILPERAVLVLVVAECQHT